MFSWAAQQLEQLSQTVAPPPTDVGGRFVYSCQKNDESSAMGCVAEFDPVTTIINPTKGTYAIHVACQHGMIRLVKLILNQPGANIQVTDAAGNSPLHYASMSSSNDALALCKTLVSECGASVVAKNAEGQTPYDVANLSTVRQYFLPLQLQQETQEALDNGGKGLPPGIDMGGLRVSGAAHSKPPPIFSPSAPNSAGMKHSYVAPAPASMPVTGIPPPMPSAPGSAGYARVGSSSAAIYSGGKGGIRADGFHSSSSDVNLQRKYGHVAATSGGNAVPPPPSSGGAAPLSGGALSGGGVNPFASGRYGSRPMASQRYVAIDPVSGSKLGPPAAGSAPSSYGYNPAMAPVASNYTMFNPMVPGKAAASASSFAQPTPSPVMPQTMDPIGNVNPQQQQGFSPVAMPGQQATAYTSPASESVQPSHYTQQSPMASDGYAQPAASEHTYPPHQQAAAPGYHQGAIGAAPTTPLVAAGQLQPASQPSQASPYQQPPGSGGFANLSAQTIQYQQPPSGTGVANLSTQTSQFQQPPASGGQGQVSAAQAFSSPAAGGGVAPSSYPTNDPSPIQQNGPNQAASTIDNNPAVGSTAAGAPNVAAQLFSSLGTAGDVGQGAAQVISAYSASAPSPGEMAPAPGQGVTAVVTPATVSGAFSEAPANATSGANDTFTTPAMPAMEPATAKSVSGSSVAEDLFAAPPPAAATTGTSAGTIGTTAGTIGTTEVATAGTTPLTTAGSIPGSTSGQSAHDLFGMPPAPGSNTASGADTTPNREQMNHAPSQSADVNPAPSGGATGNIGYVQPSLPNTSGAQDLFGAPATSSAQMTSLRAAVPVAPSSGAAELFAAPPGAAASASASVTPATAILSTTQPAMGSVTQTPASNAAELFGVGAGAAPLAAASSMASTQTMISTSGRSPSIAQQMGGQDVNAGPPDSEDELTDVPLTPGEPKSSALGSINNDINNQAGTQGTTNNTNPTTNAAESLFAAIGMPPPPFASKRLE